MLNSDKMARRETIRERNYLETARIGTTSDRNNFEHNKTKTLEGLGESERNNFEYRHSEWITRNMAIMEMLKKNQL